MTANFVTKNGQLILKNNTLLIGNGDCCCETGSCCRCSNSIENGYSILSGLFGFTQQYLESRKQLVDNKLDEIAGLLADNGYVCIFTDPATVRIEFPDGVDNPCEYYGSSPPDCPAMCNDGTGNLVESPACYVILPQDGGSFSASCCGNYDTDNPVYVSGVDHGGYTHDIHFSYSGGGNVLSDYGFFYPCVGPYSYGACSDNVASSDCCGAFIPGGNCSAGNATDCSTVEYIGDHRNPTPGPATS